MGGFKTNRLGKIIIVVGIIVFGFSLVWGFQSNSHLFDKGPLIGYGLGIAAILLGLYIRLVGNFLLLFGSIIIILSILHALLFHLANFSWLAFGLDRKYKMGIGSLELLVAVAGVLLVVCGYYFTRTEEEEEEVSARAAENRIRLQKSREIAEAERENTRAARTANIPRCPNCGAQASGNFLAGNRIMYCLTCGGAFCGRCAKGFFNRACPHCGETSQKKVRFKDTGTNW